MNLSLFEQDETSIFISLRWFTNPTTVNAFYSSSTNQISELCVSNTQLG